MTQIAMKGPRLCGEKAFQGGRSCRAAWLGCRHHVTPRACPFPHSWEWAELQIPKIIKDGWLCKCSCCAHGKRWERGRMEAILGVTKSCPCILQAPPEHQPISRPSAKGVTSHPFSLGPPRAPSPSRHHQGMTWHCHPGTNPSLSP